MSGNNGNGFDARAIDLRQVHALGQPKPKVGAGLQALVMDLDDNGMMEPDKVVVGPQGQQVPVLGRGQYVDARQLVEMIRLVVREEIAAALGDKPE